MIKKTLIAVGAMLTFGVLTPALAADGHRYDGDARHDGAREARHLRHDARDGHRRHVKRHHHRHHRHTARHVDDRR